MSVGRRRLLEGAREHFREVGADRFNMRGAASRSGVTAAALYHHFEDRTELLTEVVQIGFDRLMDYLQRAGEASTPMGRLRAGWQAYVDFAVENPRDYEWMFLDRDVPAKGFSDSLARGESPTFQFLVDQIRACIEGGELRDEDPLELSLLIWSAVHGLCSLYLAGRFEDPETFRDLARRQRDLLYAGLRPEEGRDR